MGLDFLSHPFWDKYIEFEERTEGASDRIFHILGRVILIPMHQYARYFERYRQMAHGRPVADTVPSAQLNHYRIEIENEGIGFKAGRTDVEVERELRQRIDQYHIEIFTRTQTETTKRWTYEQEIKRPYFHVTELDEGQISNWRKYLDYEEAEHDYIRTQFLYERCLVTCAMYDEFWLRYARWMLAQSGKDQEVRNIYQRASCFYVPIALPQVRLQYAFFEEMAGRIDIAKAIHDAILKEIPSHVETIVSLANLSRRHGGLDAAIEIYKTQIGSQAVEISAKAALVAQWAQLLWRTKGSAQEARQVYQQNQDWYLDSGAFWTSYLRFEIDQPTDTQTESEHYKEIKQVINAVQARKKLHPEVVKQLVGIYMGYLLERGDKDAAREYLELDREINGPSSVQASWKGALLNGKSLPNGQVS